MGPITSTIINQGFIHIHIQLCYADLAREPLCATGTVGTPCKGSPQQGQRGHPTTSFSHAHAYVISLTMQQAEKRHTNPSTAVSMQ